MEIQRKRWGKRSLKLTNRMISTGTGEVEDFKEMKGSKGKGGGGVGGQQRVEERFGGTPERSEASVLVRGVLNYS